MPGGLDHIQRLREHRGRRQRDDSIVELVRRIESDAASTQRKLGRFIDLWERLVPRELAARTSVQSISRGVVSIAVDSSSTMFELDRLLRGGLEQVLRREFQSGFVRIRLSVGETASPSEMTERQRPNQAGRKQNPSR